MYVIYENPRDFPGEFVMRRWSVVPGNPEPIPDPVPARSNTLRGIRMAVPPGLTRIPREALDDPAIVEIWV